MNKTKALLVLAILGLLAVALGTALYWQDEGPLDSGADATQPDQRPGADPGANTPDPKSSGEAAVAEGAAEADREQIATGRSKGRRQVRLQFRCETLRHNVAGVWNYMKLKVRLEDKDGQHLAEFTQPWVPKTVSIPADVERIVLMAKGYKRKVVVAPATFRKGVRPTVVFLEPDALVRVRARNLPTMPGNKFGVSARLQTGVDKQGQPLLYGVANRTQPGAEAPRGELAADIKVPSGVSAMFVVRRTRKAPDEVAGFLGLDSEVVTLKSGEQREIIVDLREFGVLEGRVTGVARPALKGQILSLQIVRDKRTRNRNFPGSVQRLEAGEFLKRGNGFGWGNSRGNFPGNYYGRGGATQTVLDADGHFRVVGLPNQPVGLRLRTQSGQWPTLQEVGSGQRQWRANEVGFLVVEPDAAVHGVVPVQAGRMLDRPFRVQPNSPPSTRRLTKKIPLFTRKILDRVSLFFFVQGIGHFNRSLAGKLPDPDGLYRVEVPVPGGSLLVHMKNQPSRGMNLFARPLALAKKIPWISITGKRTGSDWRFEGLAPGDYKLVVNYSARRGNRGVHSGRTLAETVVVKSGQETEVTVTMPELLEILGQVANWRDIPTALAPKWLQLTHAGRPHSARLDKQGAFKLTVMGPWDGVPEITFFAHGTLANLKTKDITWLPDQNRLSVMFPGNIRERWVLAEPIFGGRLWLHTYRADGSAPDGRSPWRNGRHVGPKKGNRFLIAEAGGGVDGMLLEQVHKDGKNMRLLRGWFRLRAGGPKELRVAPKGRWIQAAMAAAGGSATLTLKAPSWWQHPPYRWASLRLKGTKPQRFWLPDDATAVVVNGKREIPVARIGDQLVVD
ncbi:MAG: hypothetical protein ACYST0_01495 [Planctomycetota bacterium]|jgi:hypothetical protein